MALNFQHFPEICRFTYNPRFSVVRGLFKFFSWASSSFCDLVLLSVCWTRGSHHGCWANGFSLSSLGVVVVCVAPREKARALSHIWTDEEAGVFLFLMQGDETTIGDFNRKDAKDEFEGGGCGCRWNRAAAASSPFFYHGYSRGVAGVIQLCHRYSFYSFNAEKFNSFYSIINEWPHCWTHFFVSDRKFASLAKLLWEWSSGVTVGLSSARWLGTAWF